MYLDHILGLAGLRMNIKAPGSLNIGDKRYNMELLRSMRNSVFTYKSTNSPPKDVLSDRSSRLYLINL